MRFDMKKEKKWITLDSTVGELYESPVGHDALAKVLLQMGLPEKVITNKVVSKVKLRTIANLAKKKLGMDFFDALLHLVGLEQDEPYVSKGRIVPKWWKEAVFIRFIPGAFVTVTGMGLEI